MMMTNMLILIGLILCVSSSVDSLELGKICFRDVFEYGRPGYNALEVNSFYRIPTSFNIPSVASFCFIETEINFHDEWDQLEFESIKRNYTNTIVELLSEKNLNIRTDIFKRLSHLVDVLHELHTRYEELVAYKDAFGLYRVTKIMGDTSSFVHYVLRAFFWSLFPYSDDILNIKKKNEIEKLGDLIGNLDLSNESQIMVFNNFKIDDEEIYGKKIVQVSNFTLHRRSKLVYDFRSTSTMYYDIVLPFHDKNYDPRTKDCTRAKDLPRWFTHSL